jgi:hypothetical protein
VATGARFDMLGVLAAVVHLTPAQIPYWQGQSYSTLLWHLVPRVLVSDKPVEDLGGRFPLRYGFLGYGDDTTSFNFPQLIEWYANFGIVGVGLGMMLTGVLYRLMEHSFAASTGGALVVSTLYARATNVETNFTATFGGMPIFLVMLYLFVRMLPREQGPTAP